MRFLWGWWGRGGGGVLAVSLFRLTALGEPWVFAEDLLRCILLKRSLRACLGLLRSSMFRVTKGSLHPHVLVWLVNMSSLELLRLLSQEPAVLQERLATWMRATIMAIESTTQSTVSALPRRFGDCARSLPSLPFSQQERSITRFDGGCELDVLKEDAAHGFSLSQKQSAFLEEADPVQWPRLTCSFPLTDLARGNSSFAQTSRIRPPPSQLSLSGLRRVRRGQLQEHDPRGWVWANLSSLYSPQRVWCWT